MYGYVNALFLSNHSGPMLQVLDLLAVIFVAYWFYEQATRKDSMREWKLDGNSMEYIEELTD